VLEDQSGELIEILCVKCRGSIGPDSPLAWLKALKSREKRWRGNRDTLLKCHGAIGPQEERAQEQQAYERFDGDPRKLAGYSALEDMRKRATYSQGGYTSEAELLTLLTRCHGIVWKTTTNYRREQWLPGEDAGKLQESITVAGRRADDTIISETLMVPEDDWAQYTSLFPIFPGWGML
jgi:5-methylcytosine-specific restriction endonuclease McrA